MTELENWLSQATRGLSRDSAAQVRTEIQQHYESGHEAALHSGASAPEADRLGVTALGDPEAANRQYRKVLLTSAEARLLRQGNWEASAVCSRPWLKWVILAASVAACIAGIVARSITLAGIGLGIGLLFAAPRLPIYTPSRSRIYRYAKIAVLISVPTVAFGPDALKWSWLLVSCLWTVVWVERTRVSIRRKLPVARWPKQLYL